VAGDVDSARRDWEDAFRRLERDAGDVHERERLHVQLEVVLDELRKRVGARFTLQQLANEYVGAESWVRGVVSERAPAPGWPRTLSVVEGAAFHVYSRGAEDYAP
jgi:hypothetical protein